MRDRRLWSDRPSVDRDSRTAGAAPAGWTSARKTLVNINVLMNNFDDRPRETSASNVQHAHSKDCNIPSTAYTLQPVYKAVIRPGAGDRDRPGKSSLIETWKRTIEIPAGNSHRTPTWLRRCALVCDEDPPGRVALPGKSPIQVAAELWSAHKICCEDQPDQDGQSGGDPKNHSPISSALLLSLIGLTSLFRLPNEIRFPLFSDQIKCVWVLHRILQFS